MKETAEAVRREGQECLAIAGDIGDEQFCRSAVDQTVKKFGKLDVLVNNAAEQHEQESIEGISEQQLVRTFKTNVFGYFFMTKAALQHLKEGSAIVNTTSVTAYKGSAQLLDYSPTRGAIVAFTRSQQLADRKIRVNGVAPGPIWTPLIPASFDEERVAQHGANVPLGRPRPAQRGRALPPVPGQRGRVLHDRPDPAQRRQHRRRLSGGGRLPGGSSARPPGVRRRGACCSWENRSWLRRASSFWHCCSASAPWASPRARTRVRPSRPAESVDNAAERAGEALEDAGEKVQREAE